MLDGLYILRKMNTVLGALIISFLLVMGLILLFDTKEVPQNPQHTETHSAQ